MQPFWRSISVPVVRQYQSKPQIVETLISWLGMTMDSFLILTEKFTVPYLVLEGKKEMIRRIGKNSNRTMAVVCHDNMNHIMPVLLIQDVPNVEKHAINLFRTLSKKFDSSSLKELLWPDATFVAAELLIFAGDAGKDEVDRRARVTLYSLSMLVHCLPIHRPLKL